MFSSLQECYAGRRVFVTGHTGFKGSWLCQWLLQMRAQVRGYALDPPTSPALFNDLQLGSRLQDVRADIRDSGRLLRELRDFEPEFVFHLAAQPLVRYSYRHPVETYETNVMGTVYLLDALRTLNRPCAVVIVTTDKCYENREWVYGYREDDPMGGADPYSSSKGMAELAVAAWRRSFCQDGRIRLSTARAGNVIGGGDWALDRIVPDCVRAVQSGRPIDVRYPFATRPWQHVLDPLNGYLALGQRLDTRINGHDIVEPFCGGFNFGPSAASNRPVRDVVEELFKHLPGTWRNLHTGPAVHEAAKLHLCVDKSHHLLGWRNVFDFTAALRETAGWYRGYSEGVDAQVLCQSSIESFGRLMCCVNSKSHT